MTYTINNKYFGQLNGSNSTRISAGANGTSSGIKGVLAKQEDYDWITANGSNNEFTLSKESIIFGYIASSNSSSDFYHKYKAVGTSMPISHAAMTNAEGAGTYGKVDEDILAVCSGTFSIEVIGKYNTGWFCEDESKIFVLRNK